MITPMDICILTVVVSVVGVGLLWALEVLR